MENTSPTRQRAGKYIGTFLSIIMIVAGFGAGVLVGEGWYARKHVLGADGQIDIAKVIDLNRAINHSDSVDFDQFWQVWDKIKQNYVKQPVKDTDLFYGAIQGMVYGLGDPYSVYFPPKAASDFSKSLSGEFSGIGAEIGIKNNDLVVIAPLPGTPAAAAGLRPGDKITAIDKKSTVGMDVATAVENIRGSSTSSVVLSIARAGSEKIIDFSIHRATINIPAVIYETKPGNIAYLRIMQFNERTVPELGGFIDQLKTKNAKGIILDLRNNPGGYLDAAVAMASEWVPTGSIVSEKFSAGNENVHSTAGSHRLAGIKTVVLVNGGSASASEIVAGALQDHKVATLLGEKTYGKGSVQEFETLSDGSALKVTVAEWYTPNGNNINKTGISPDVVLKEDYSKEKVGQDSMIDKALQLLKK